MQKPLSLATRDYLQSMCDITNSCGLPAFVVVDTLTKLLNQMQIEAEKELKRDEAAYRAAVQNERPKMDSNQE